MKTKKDLKTVRKNLMSELKLLRKGKITNQRALSTVKLANQIHINIRLKTSVQDEI